MMDAIRNIWVWLLAATLAAGLTRPASAEWFVDVYGGIAMVEDTTVTGTITSAFGSVQSAAENVSFDTAPSLGVRGGYWFREPKYLGLAGDLSYFRADGDNVVASTTGLSLMLIGRLPLFESEDYPNGRLQPYAAIGFGYFSSSVTADLRPALSRELEISGGSVGLDARAGVAFQISKLIAVFVEYRYTSFEVDIEEENTFFLVFPGGSERISMDLTAQHYLAGVSFRF